MVETAKTLGIIAGCILFIPGVLLVLFGFYTYVTLPSQRREIGAIAIFVPLIGGTVIGVAGLLGLVGGLLVSVAPLIASAILLCLGITITVFSLTQLLGKFHDAMIYVGVFLGLCYSSLYLISGILTFRTI